MEAHENQIALPLRAHTILGVCEAIGEDFGFNPVFLRIPLAAMVVVSPLWAIGGYFALGAGRARVAPAVPESREAQSVGRPPSRRLAKRVEPSRK